MRNSRILFSLAAALFVAACDSDTTTSPQVTIDAALDQMATSGISTYSAAAVQAGAGAGGLAVPAIAAPATDASACVYNASTQFFVCPPVTSNSLTFSRSFQMLDASGTPLSVANPTALSSVRSVVDVEGTIPASAETPATIEIKRHEDATLSGIRSTSRVLNSNATQRLAVTTTSFGFVSNDTSTTSNLQLPASSDQKWPLGGTILTRRTVDFSGFASTTHKQTEKISFDGTSVMTVEVTTATAVATCKINLATPGAQPVCT